MSGAAKFVWFDFGGVLSPPLSELFDSYATRTGIPSDVLQQAMKSIGTEYSLPTLAPIELALLDERTWVAKQHDFINREHPDVDTALAEPEFGRQWFSGHSPNSDMRQFAVDLVEEGTRIGILSNNVVEWEPYWRAMVDLDEVATVIIDSCRVGVRKPDPEIFAIAADAANIAAEDCVLIDDLPENCAAARKAGWTAVQYITAEQAIADVRRVLTESSPQSSRQG